MGSIAGEALECFPQPLSCLSRKVPCADNGPSMCRAYSRNKILITKVTERADLVQAKETTAVSALLRANDCSDLSEGCPSRENITSGAKLAAKLAGEGEA